MAKTTYATVHQEIPLEKKGIEINVWSDDVKGGRLVIRRASVEWWAPNAKVPWSGTWEEFAMLFKEDSAKCDHCGVVNDVARDQTRQKCVACGKTFKIEW